MCLCLRYREVYQCCWLISGIHQPYLLLARYSRKLLKYFLIDMVAFTLLCQVYLFLSQFLQKCEQFLFMGNNPILFFNGICIVMITSWRNFMATCQKRFNFRLARSYFYRLFIEFIRQVIWNAHLQYYIGLLGNRNLICLLSSCLASRGDFLFFTFFLLPQSTLE